MKEKGNVLFLILVAVVLFAALSYAVTQSSRGGGNADNEVLELETAQILQYATSIDLAVQRIMLSGGYDISEVDFQTPGGNNTNCSVDKCRVFSTSDFGVSYQAPKIEWLAPDNGDTWWGEYRAGHFPVDGVGTAGIELLWFLPNIREDICIKINETFGLTDGNTAPPETAMGINLSGWYTGGAAGGNVIGDTADIIEGHLEGCFETSGGGRFVFYKVIFIR